MFAIDTNLLVYAHNTDSEFHEQSAAFVTQMINERDQKGRYTICLPTQVLSEFVHVITWQRVEKPLSITEAIRVIQDYIERIISNCVRLFFIQVFLFNTVDSFYNLLFFMKLWN